METEDSALFPRYSEKELKEIQARHEPQNAGDESMDTPGFRIALGVTAGIVYAAITHFSVAANFWLVTATGLIGFAAGYLVITGVGWGLVRRVRKAMAK